MNQNQSHSIINDVLQSVLQNSLGSLSQNRNIEYNITFDKVNNLQVFYTYMDYKHEAVELLF